MAEATPVLHGELLSYAAPSQSQISARCSPSDLKDQVIRGIWLRRILALKVNAFGLAIKCSYVLRTLIASPKYAMSGDRHQSYIQGLQNSPCVVSEFHITLHLRGGIPDLTRSVIRRYMPPVCYPDA